MATLSSGLGLESPYVAVEASADLGPVDVLARASDATKAGSDQGGGAFAAAVVAREFGVLELGVGAFSSHQVHDDWTKTTAGAAAKLSTETKRSGIELWLFGPDGDKVEWSAMIRVVGLGRVAPVFEAERVRHSLGDGDRVGLGVLWKLNTGD